MNYVEKPSTMKKALTWTFVVFCMLLLIGFIVFIVYWSDRSAKGPPGFLGLSWFEKLLFVG